MKKSWLPAGVLVAGLALIALSVIGSRAGALHIIGILRVCLLIAGLALIAAALDTLGLVPVRAYAHRLQASFPAGSRVPCALPLWTLGPAGVYVSSSVSASGRFGRLAPITMINSRAPSGPAISTWHPVLTPALLALSNPYDPDARKGIPGLQVEQPGTIWDMSLYDGRVYLYWGPAPALLLSAIKLRLSGSGRRSGPDLCLSPGILPLPGAATDQDPQPVLPLRPGLDSYSWHTSGRLHQPCSLAPQHPPDLRGRHCRRPILPDGRPLLRLHGPRPPCSFSMEACARRPRLELCGGFAGHARNSRCFSRPSWFCSGSY